MVAFIDNPASVGEKLRDQKGVSRCNLSDLVNSSDVKEREKSLGFLAWATCYMVVPSISWQRPGDKEEHAFGEAEMVLVWIGYIGRAWKNEMPRRPLSPKCLSC